MSETQIILVVPRLWAALHAVARQFGSTWEGRRPWERFLNRGQYMPLGSTDGIEATVLKTAAIPHDPALDLPVAALSRRGDGLDQPDGFWLRADPVSLRADRDDVLLVDWDMVDLNDAAALSLARDLTPLFEPLGWKLYTPVPQRWYVHLSSILEVRTCAPRVSFATSVLGKLPAGRDAPLLRRVLTEVQMTLHASPVNHERTQRGKPAVNSLWMWGAGAGPSTVPPFAHYVWSDEAFLTGLARLAQIPCSPVPLDASRLDLCEGDNWLSFSALDQLWRHGDVQVLAQALVRFHDTWLQPILTKLGRTGRMTILSDSGRCWMTTGNDQRRWWVRRHDLDQVIGESE